MRTSSLCTNIYHKRSDAIHVIKPDLNCERAITDNQVGGEGKRVDEAQIETAPLYPSPSIFTEEAMPNSLGLLL